MTDKSLSGGAPLSVARVTQILKQLSTSDEALSLAELARRLSAPKTSLIGLLRGLVDMNYVVVTGGFYRLGGSSFELASAVLSSRRRLHMGDYIRTGMAELGNKAGETVLYGVLTGDEPAEMTYIGLVESRNAIRISVGVGDRSALYCTAGGRVLLSDRSREQIEKYLSLVAIEAFSPLTQTDPHKLLERIDAVRSEQFSCVRDEMINGITGMAAPIRDSSAKILGALIIAGPTVRMDTDMPILKAMVIEHARRISLNLGYQGGIDTGGQ